MKIVQASVRGLKSLKGASVYMYIYIRIRIELE